MVRNYDDTPVPPLKDSFRAQKGSRFGSLCPPLFLWPAKELSTAVLLCGLYQTCILLAAHNATVPPFLPRSLCPTRLHQASGHHLQLKCHPCLPLSQRFLHDRLLAIELLLSLIPWLVLHLPPIRRFRGLTIQGKVPATTLHVSQPPRTPLHFSHAL